MCVTSRRDSKGGGVALRHTSDQNVRIYHQYPMLN